MRIAAKNTTLLVLLLMQTATCVNTTEGGKSEDVKPKLIGTDSTTIKECLESSDVYEGIGCVLRKKEDNKIDKPTADNVLRHFLSKITPERFLYALGINSNLGVEIGVYNDPSGRYIELHQRYLRYGKTDIGVTHQKVQNKYAIVYSWDDISEPEPFNHWTSYTALRGSPGYHLAYAHGGKAKGLKNQNTFSTDCGGVSDIMKLNTKYYEHVSIFMGADKLCMEKKEDYDIIIGKYQRGEMTFRGRKVENYAPDWECYFNGDSFNCYGAFTPAENTKLQEIADSLN